MRALIGKGAVVARYAYSERIYYNLERGERCSFAPKWFSNRGGSLHSGYSLTISTSPVQGMKWLSVLVLSCLLLHLLIDELVDHRVRCRRKTLLGCKLIDLWYDTSVSKGGLTPKTKATVIKRERGEGWSRNCKKLTLVDHGAFASLLEPTQEASAAALAASTLLVHVASAHVASTLNVVVAAAHIASTLVVVTTVAHVPLVAATHLAFSGLLAFADEVIHVWWGR
jgi:hypothetical protein